MRRTLTLAMMLVVATARSWGQSARQLAREAEIKMAAPYATMLAQDPTLTIEQYNAAVRALAQRNRVPSTYLTPPAPAFTSSESTATAIGPFTYSSDSAGVTGTTSRIGPFTYYQDSSVLTGHASR